MRYWTAETDLLIVPFVNSLADQSGYFFNIAYLIQ